MEKIDSKQLIRYLKQNSNDLGVLLNIFSSNDYNEALEQINVGAFIFNNMRIIKSTYLSYIDNLSYDDRVYLYKRFDYPIIPTITFFDFMNNITI